MASTIKSQLLLVLAFLSAPVLNSLLKGAQLQIGSVIILLLIGTVALVLLRWSASKHLNAHLAIDLSDRAITYDIEPQPPLKKNFDDIRRISERILEGLKIQFFNTKTEIFISSDTPQYAEIKRLVATHFYLESETPTKVMPFIFFAGIGAVALELLFLRGTVLHGMVAVLLGLSLAYGMLSTPEPIAFFRQTGFLDRTTSLGSVLLFMYSIIIVILGQRNV